MLAIVFPTCFFAHLLSLLAFCLYFYHRLITNSSHSSQFPPLTDSFPPHPDSVLPSSVFDRSQAEALHSANELYKLLQRDADEALRVGAQVIRDGKPVFEDNETGTENGGVGGEDDKKFWGTIPGQLRKMINSALPLASSMQTGGGTGNGGGNLSLPTSDGRRIPPSVLKQFTDAMVEEMDRSGGERGGVVSPDLFAATAAKVTQHFQSGYFDPIPSGGGGGGNGGSGGLTTTVTIQGGMGTINVSRDGDWSLNGAKLTKQQVDMLKNRYPELVSSIQRGGRDWKVGEGGKMVMVEGEGIEGEEGDELTGGGGGGEDGGKKKKKKKRKGGEKADGGEEGLGQTQAQVQGQQVQGQKGTFGTGRIIPPVGPPPSTGIPPTPTNQPLPNSNPPNGHPPSIRSTNPTPPQSILSHPTSLPPISRSSTNSPTLSRPPFKSHSSAIPPVPNAPIIDSFSKGSGGFGRGVGGGGRNESLQNGTIKETLQRKRGDIGDHPQTQQQVQQQQLNGRGGRREIQDDVSVRGKGGRRDGGSGAGGYGGNVGSGGKPQGSSGANSTNGGYANSSRGYLGATSSKGLDEARETRKKVGEYFMKLSEAERRKLLRIEKESIIKVMKDLHRGGCNCSTCGRKKQSLESELDSLYESYYQELSNHSDRYRRSIDSNGSIPPPPGPGPFPGSVDLDRLPVPAGSGNQQGQPARNKTTIKTTKSHKNVKPAVKKSTTNSNSNSNNTHASNNAHQNSNPAHGEVGHKHSASCPHRQTEERGKRTQRDPPSDDERYDEDEEVDEEEEDEEEYDDDEEEEEEEEEYDDDERDPPSIDDRPTARRAHHHNQAALKPPRDIANPESFCGFTVKGDILTIADELLQNNGARFLEMMETLAETRAKREREIMGGFDNGSGLEDEDEYDDDDEGTNSEDDEESEGDEDMDDDHGFLKPEEGRKMFEIFAARLLEQRVHDSYKEAEARKVEEALLREIEEQNEENRLKEEKKARDQQKKKEKKKAQKAKQEEEKARKEQERLEEERKAEAEREARVEEEKRRAEELRLKREADKKAREADKIRKEEERRKRADEEAKKKREKDEKARLEREARAKKQKEDAERKAKEDAEKKAKEEEERKVREEREAKARAEKEAKEAKEKEEREKREQVEREKAAAAAKLASSQKFTSPSRPVPKPQTSDPRSPPRATNFNSKPPASGMLKPVPPKIVPPPPMSLTGKAQVTIPPQLPRPPVAQINGINGALISPPPSMITSSFVLPPLPHPLGRGQSGPPFAGFEEALTQTPPSSKTAIMPPPPGAFPNNHLPPNLNPMTLNGPSTPPIPPQVPPTSRSFPPIGSGPIGSGPTRTSSPSLSAQSFGSNSVSTLSNLNSDSVILTSRASVGDLRPIGPIGPVRPPQPIGTTVSTPTLPIGTPSTDQTPRNRPKGKEGEERSNSPPTVLGSKALADDGDVPVISNKWNSAYQQNVWDLPSKAVIGGWTTPGIVAAPDPFGAFSPSPSLPQFSRSSVIRDRTKLTYLHLKQEAPLGEFIRLSDVHAAIVRMYPDASNVKLDEVLASTNMESTPENGGGMFDVQWQESTPFIRWRDVPSRAVLGISSGRWN